MTQRNDASHRQFILDLVRRTGRHPTADDVFMSARATVPTISLTTVYRNLRRLVADGQLRERMFGGVSRFDAHLAEHGHLVCSGCGAIVDIAADGRALVATLKPAAGAWVVENVDVELRGRCPQCEARVAGDARPQRRDSHRHHHRHSRHPGEDGRAAVP